MSIGGFAVSLPELAQGLSTTKSRITGNLDKPWIAWLLIKIVLYIPRPPCTHACRCVCKLLWMLSYCHTFYSLICVVCLEFGCWCYFLFKKDFIYFIFRERGREGARKGEKRWYVRETLISCLFLAPSWGPGMQPGHVPQLEIAPVTFRFTGLCSIHWAPPAKAIFFLCEK